MVGGTGLAPARARAHEFLRLACMHSTTRRKNWCGRRDSHSHELALRSSRYQRDASLPTLGRHKNGRDGRTRTFAVREDGAFTARCNCCCSPCRPDGTRMAHPSRCSGLRRLRATRFVCHVSKLEARAGFAPARTRRMKPSHCCCATEPKWWVASVMLRVLPVKSRLLHG
ncbi:MAG: hypothetical protein K0R17_367 [Rariglobus sp.]|nr:hypothetical protein [Rariglobus sp.]